jgi:hypothetical protein
MDDKKLIKPTYDSYIFSINNKRNGIFAELVKNNIFLLYNNETKNKILEYCILHSKINTTKYILNFDYDNFQLMNPSTLLIQSLYIKTKFITQLLLEYIEEHNIYYNYFDILYLNSPNTYRNFYHKSITNNLNIIDHLNEIFKYHDKNIERIDEIIKLFIDIIHFKYISSILFRRNNIINEYKNLHLLISLH